LVNTRQMPFIVAVPKLEKTKSRTRAREGCRVRLRDGPGLRPGPCDQRGRAISSLIAGSGSKARSAAGTKLSLRDRIGRARKALTVARSA
jgi:hypothetical protein